MIDKTLKKWWVRWVVKPDLETVEDHVSLTIGVFELKKLVESVRRDERSKNARLMKFKND